MFGTTPLFGASTLPTYGTTNQNPFAPSLYGQPTPNANLFSTANFAQPAGFSYPAFNKNPPVRQGTTLKYAPVQETEVSLKNGISTMARLRLLGITCMKEYENKSFEELRHEDYILNKSDPAFGNQAKPMFSSGNSAKMDGLDFPRSNQYGNFSRPASSNLLGSTGNSLFGGNLLPTKPLFGSKPVETKRFSFDIQPTTQASKSDSNMESCELRKPKPVGFNWFNKPEPAPVQQTFTLPNTTPPFVFNTTKAPSSFCLNPIPTSVVSCPPPQVPSFELKSPPGVDELRKMFALTGPFGVSTIFNDLDVCQLSNYKITPDYYPKRAEEILERVDREVKPKTGEVTERLREMYGLFKTAEEAEPRDDYLVQKLHFRELRIKNEISPPPPLIIDPYINKEGNGVKVQVDAGCSVVPVSSDSPSILTLPKTDSSSDMHQVAAKNLATGIVNTSELSIQVIEGDNEAKPGVVIVELPDTIKPNCGITLTKPDYYTLPRLNDILKFANPDGTCLVKGFTVGRVGYGNVHFPEPLDVTDLDLDRIVEIGYREITVYPDDADKPPVGEGLNRRAQVTLDKIYPRREDGELETDVENLQARRYEDTLRIISVRMEVDFVEYRPQTGSWVFVVPHFSKYQVVE